MIVIKSIEKRSTAKFAGIIYALIGFVGFLSLTLGIIIDLIRTREYQGSVFGLIAINLASGILGGAITALIMGLLGSLLGYLLAAVYNFYAKKGGGIRMDLREE